jgi:molybdopterin synthase sulfur carrier subunit
MDPGIAAAELCGTLLAVVRILYFAALRDLTGRSEEGLELPDEVRTVRDFLQHLQRIRPALAGKLASVRVALDEAFAKDSDALRDVQVIALIPPVAGG